MIDSQMNDMIREKLTLKEQIDSLEQKLSKQIKENESLFKTFIVFKNESKEKENKYLENEIDLEMKIKELVDVPSELPKVSLVNASLKKLKFHLTQFDSVVKKRTTPSALEEGVKCSTSNCGSKLQAIKGMIGSRRHQHSLSKMNSEILCATCNKSMFDGVHDKYLLNLVQNGNKRTKSAKKHKKQNVWKCTGHVFTEVGFKWKPIGKTFTIVGSSKIAKIIESKNANHSEPNQTWGSNATDIPLSSSLFMTGCPDCTLIRERPDCKIMGYGDYQLGNVVISRVYYVEGLGHNLFSVGQFCNADLEVAF
ncbi:hypothetical protein Tco_1202418 [Tanacetum coccineum]